MPHADDVTMIAREFLNDPSQAQIESLIRTTPETGYRIEQIRTILGLKDKVKVGDIKSAFHESKSKRMAENCGSCQQYFGIPILDKLSHRTIQSQNPHEYETPNFIPTVYAPCPNCSGSERAATLISRMSDEELAWCWIVLYQFYIFNLQQNCPAEQFNTSEYWDGINIDPIFTPRQRAMIKTIAEGQELRGYVSNNQINKIHKAISKAESQMAVPF